MRRVAVRRKLQRISKTYRVIGKDDLPNVRVAHPLISTPPIHSFIHLPVTYLFIYSSIYLKRYRASWQNRMKQVSMHWHHWPQFALSSIQSVHKYVTHEYVRACLVSYDSLPKDVYHEGWGRPGTLLRYSVRIHPSISSFLCFRSHPIWPHSCSLKLYPEPHIRIALPFIHFFLFCFPSSTSTFARYLLLHLLFTSQAMSGTK